MTQIKKRNSILNSLQTGTTINLDNNSNYETPEKNEEEVIVPPSNSESRNDKQAKGKNKKASFILDILDKDVVFDVKKTKFVTFEMSEKLRLLSGLTGKSEQIIMHSILNKFFKENESNMKQLLKEFM